MANHGNYCLSGGKRTRARKMSTMSEEACSRSEKRNGVRAEKEVW